MDNISARVQRNEKNQIKATLTLNDRNIKGTLTVNNNNMQGVLGASRTYPVIKVQEKTTVSSLVKQEIVPDEPFKLSKVTINPLPITRTLNSKGGYTIQIGV